MTLHDESMTTLRNKILRKWRRTRDCRVTSTLTIYMTMRFMHTGTRKRFSLQMFYVSAVLSSESESEYTTPGGVGGARPDGGASLPPRRDLRSLLSHFRAYRLVSNVARSKSMMFTQPSDFNRRFSGRMSLCMTPARWMSCRILMKASLEAKAGQ